MRSLIAVGEEVRDKIEKEELKQVASKGVEDAKRTLVELNRHCLEIKSSGGFGFDDSMKFIFSLISSLHFFSHFFSTIEGKCWGLEKKCSWPL